MKKRNILIIILAFLGIFLIGLFVFYEYEVSPIDKTSNAKIEVVIPNGMSTKNIGKLLKNKGLIRNADFFAIFVKLNNKSSLKATTYTLKKNMSLEKIVNTLSEGNNYNPDIVKITFKEGENVTDYATLIANHTNHTYNEIIDTINDKTYLKTLIEKYWFLTDDILNEAIYYPLEGYLAPNTYEFKNKDVKIEKIIETMLNQTEEELKDLKDKMTNQTYTIHEYITLASIAQLEGTNVKNRKMIIGIFNNRLKNHMNLGSDVTTYYALQTPMTSDLTAAQFNTKNPYNTRTSDMAGKISVGPICNPEKSSIEAAINPTESDYLFFVADKNGEIYYTKSNAEHTAKVQELKANDLWIW